MTKLIDLEPEDWLRVLQQEVDALIAEAKENQKAINTLKKKVEEMEK
jgi:hypothetical protein